jgi:hypothetical protein
MTPTPTHCLWENPPVLGTGELPVPNISGPTITTFNPPAGVGNRRGVIVFLHGLNIVPTAIPVPFSVTDLTGVFASEMYFSWCTNMANDGWIVLAVPYAEDPYITLPAVGIYNDVSNDATDGARVLESTWHTWQHVYAYIQQTYGSNFPVGIAGHSEGAWKALQIAVEFPTQVDFFMAHQPVTVWSNASPSYTPGENFGLLNTSGMDLGPTALNGLPSTLKGIVGYGTSDTAVWYGGNSTVATINGGTSPVAAASVTAFTVSGGSLLYETGGVQYVTLTNLTGGIGRATYSYTTYSAGAFSGLTLISGSGSVTTTSVAEQSAIDSMLTAALGLSLPITRLSTAEDHSLCSQDAGVYTTAGYTLTSSGQTVATGLISDTNNGTGLISGSSAIKDTSGTWHTITFTAATGGTSQITNVAIASGSATIANGAPICNTGSAITGGFSNQSYPYWLSTVIDPSYPATL